MGYSLSEEQQLIQQTAREFAQEYVQPAAADIDRTGNHPADIVGKMAAHDFLGLYLPGEFGGAEAGYLSYALTVEELAKASGAVASILVSHASMAAYAINRWGSAAIKNRYLGALCKGELLGSFAAVEPGAGPGAGADKVIAARDGDDYVLNGKKAYVANGGAAGVYVVLAVTDPAEGPKGLSAFVVDASTDGLAVTRIIGKMGLRGCRWAELAFKDAKVPAGNLLGREGAGLAIMAEVAAVAGVAEGAQVVGIAQAAMEDAAKYAKQRVQFGRPIASFPAIQNMLAEMATNIHLARLAVYHAAEQIEKGEQFAVAAAMVRLCAARIGQSTLIDVIQVEGGYGYSKEMVVSRYYRDVKGVVLADSSVEFPAKTIAAEVLA
jgi:butyryl-CoA dehydrogenase